MSRDQNIYRIPYVGLKEGQHSFGFDITEKFFEAFDITDIEKAEILVDIDFNKKYSHFELSFDIQGYMFTTCDRCLAQYPQELLDEFKIFVKLTDEIDQESDDPNVIFLNRQETHFDVKQLIYEFIQLSLPLQKVCGEKPGKTEYCNKDVLKHINKHEASSFKEEDNNDIDPRWAALKNIKK